MCFTHLCVGWQCACIAVDAGSWLERVTAICKANDLPLPLEEEQLPVGNGSNPVLSNFVDYFKHNPHKSWSFTFIHCSFPCQSLEWNSVTVISDTALHNVVAITYYNIIYLPGMTILQDDLIGICSQCCNWVNVVQLCIILSGWDIIYSFILQIKTFFFCWLASVLFGIFCLWDRFTLLVSM